MTKSDGSSADYYKLPANATELQHLISYRNLNAQDGEIFRAIYRKGLASHSSALRDAKKVLFYARAEVDRLEQEMAMQADFGQQNMWPADDSRMDIIGQNGPTGEHYGAPLKCSDCQTYHLESDRCPALLGGLRRT